MPVIVSPGGRAKIIVFAFPFGIIVTKRDECCSPDCNRVSAKCQSLSNVSATANTTRNYKLDFAVHTHVLQGANRFANTREDRLADVFDKDVLRRGRTTLHTIKDHDIGPGFNSKCSVEIRAGAADLNVDWHFPTGDLTQFQNFDL